MRTGCKYLFPLYSIHCHYSYGIFKKILILSSLSFFFSFWVSTLKSCLRSHHVPQYHEDMDLSCLRETLGLYFIFRYIVHLKLIFAYGVTEGGVYHLSIDRSIYHLSAHIHTPTNTYTQI